MSVSMPSPLFISNDGSEIVSLGYLMASGRPVEYRVEWSDAGRTATVTWEGEPHAIYTRM